MSRDLRQSKTMNQNFLSRLARLDSYFRSYRNGDKIEISILAQLPMIRDDWWEMKLNQQCINEYQSVINSQRSETVSVRVIKSDCSVTGGCRCQMRLRP
jgi:hypothetical protein